MVNSYEAAVRHRHRKLGRARIGRRCVKTRARLRGMREKASFPWSFPTLLFVFFHVASLARLQLSHTSPSSFQSFEHRSHSSIPPVFVQTPLLHALALQIEFADRRIDGGLISFSPLKIPPGQSDRRQRPRASSHGVFLLSANAPSAAGLHGRCISGARRSRRTWTGEGFRDCA